MPTPNSGEALGWRPAADLRFAASLEAIALSADEIGRAAQSLPVAFTRGPAGWQAMAVFSPGDGRNHWVDEAQGHWRGPYLPALLRAYPFRLAPGAGQALQLWPGVQPEPMGPGLEPFLVEGQASDRLKHLTAFLLAVHQGMARVAEPLDILAVAGALKPWPMPLGDIPWALGGRVLMRLDREVFEALPEPDFLRLRTLGALEWLFAHLQSLHHAAPLLELATQSANTLSPEMASQLSGLVPDWP